MPEFTPRDFVAKWKHVTAREKQTYQEHFLDICHLVHEPTPNEADPTGTVYAFKMDASKTTGGQGWADVAKIHLFFPGSRKRAWARPARASHSAYRKGTLAEQCDR